MSEKLSKFFSYVLRHQPGSIGQRHGKPVVFQIDTLRMRDKGLAFFLADNGVWLTDQVAPEFLTLMPD